MLKNYKLLLAFVLLFCTQLSADTWTKTYGGTGYDVARSVQQTKDSGFIVVGYTNSFGAGNYDIYLIKTNSSGDTLWTRTFGGTNDDKGYSVRQTKDSGFIIAGTTYSFGADSGDVYLIRTNSLGDTLWTKTFGGTDKDYGYLVQQTQDSGFIIAGTTYSFGAGSADVYLIKINFSGDTLWTKTFGGTNWDYGYSVQQTFDGGFIIVGGTGSFGVSDGAVYLIKTDSLGDTLWSKTFPGEGRCTSGNSVQQTSDSGFIIAGTILVAGEGPGASFVYLIRTNSSGNTLWAGNSGTNNSAGESVQQTQDGGFIITGHLSNMYGGTYLIRIDSLGNNLWKKVFSGSGGYSVQELQDNGFIIAGYTYSGDVCLIKTDSLGYVAVEESSTPQSAFQNPQLQISPNLFTNQTVLMYQIPATSKVSLSFYDITGSCVKTLVNELKPAGTYSILLNSNGLKTGVYFCKMQAGDFKATTKLTLLK
ncbi:MAG: T9SS type A sorting domain-containing protein [bacterium]